MSYVVNAMNFSAWKKQQVRLVPYGKICIGKHGKQQVSHELEQISHDVNLYKDNLTYNRDERREKCTKNCNRFKTKKDWRILL